MVQKIGYGPLSPKQKRVNKKGGKLNNFVGIKTPTNTLKTLKQNNKVKTYKIAHYFVIHGLLRP